MESSCVGAIEDTMKYLITGASGFVAGYMIPLILDREPSAQILGISRNVLQVPFPSDERVTLQAIDINDRAALQSEVEAFAPHFIIHLASSSSVRYSWDYPTTSFQNNTNIYLNLLESVRQSGLSCRILSVGSSEQYGVVSPDAVPLSEEFPVNPVSPYAVARVAQEMLSKVYVSGFELDIVMTRSFNHFGPGQRDSFVLSSFSKQLAEKKRDQDLSPMRVGALSVIRDFLDVRDVVQAYFLLLNHGTTGEVYNVCRGEGHSLHDILGLMKEISGVACNAEVNPELLRPIDNPVIVGDRSKIQREVGWEPSYSLEESIRDMFHYWEERLSSLPHTVESMHFS